ncbi:MAG: efflux RND transporter periplasmic adaptor subunit [Phycisphaerales bacterium]
MNRLADHSAPIRFSLQWLFTGAGVVVLLALLTGASGCKKHQEGDGHDHGTPKPAAKGDAHAGHDHGSGSKEGGEGAHADEVKLTPDAIGRYGIKNEAAQMWVLKPTVVTPARVAFNTEAMAHVGSPLRGRAVEVKVRLGDTVKAGQELVIIESPELGEAQADFLQKKTAVLTAGPAVDLSKIAWERAKGLYEQSQGISLTEVQRREAEYKVAIANVKAAEAAAMASENRLHLLGMKQNEVATLASTSEIAPRHAIKAAIEGQVVQREITLGELVGPDREAIMILADTRSLWVLADVPESKLMGIAVGAKAWITIGSTTGQSDGAAAPRFEGTVSFIAPLVDPTTRTAQVRIDVPASLDNGLTLKPGMFAQAEIVASMPGGTDPAPVVAVPDEAIQTVEGGPAIFVPVAGEPNTFAKRAVTIGKPIGGLVPIYSGLVEGERFVIAGTFILKAELGKGSAAHEH